MGEHSDYLKAVFDDLKRNYDGKKVAIYCSTGNKLVGFARFGSQWIDVKSVHDGNTTTCNPEYIVAITVTN